MVPELENFLVMPFHEIMDAVISGQGDAGQGAETRSSAGCKANA